MPDLREDEADELDELPPIGPLDDDDEGPSEDALGAPLDTGEGEQVGLDDAAGVDDPALFALELPPDEPEDDGGELDAIPLADLRERGAEELEEYGWADDGVPRADDAWDLDELELPALTPFAREDDGGAEGVDEPLDPARRGDDDGSGLPPLEAGPDVDDDEIELGLDATEDAFGAVLPPRLEGVRVERLTDEPSYDVVIDAGEPWSVTASGLHRGGSRLASEGLRGVPRTLARAHAAWLVGTDLGVFRSLDEGATFEAIALLDGVRQLVVDGGGRVWARGASGRLQRSDDGGVSWTPPLLLTRVCAIAAPVWGVVALSAPEAGRAQLASSEDGGARWAASTAPSVARGPEGRELALAARDDRVVLGGEGEPGGPVLSRDRGRTWVRLPGLPRVTALALGASRELVVLAAHPAEGGLAIVQHVVDRDAGSGVLVDRVAAVHRLVATEGALYAATDAGLLRIVRTEARE